MKKFVMSSVVLLMLAACGGGMGAGGTGSDGNEDAVCGQQSDWARSGKVGGGDITITCPGYARPGADYATQAQPVYENEYNRNADIYRAGFAGAVAVATAK